MHVLSSNQVRLTFAQIKTVIADVLMALYHIHSSDVGHGNLCYENLIYSTDGEEKEKTKKKERKKKYHLSFSFVFRLHSIG